MRLPCRQRSRQTRVRSQQRAVFAAWARAHNRAAEQAARSCVAESGASTGDDGAVMRQLAVLVERASSIEAHYASP